MNIKYIKKWIFSILLITIFTNTYADILPKDIKWQTNWNEPKIGSPDAKRGGTYHTYINSFPQTLRTVGPNSNGYFRGWILDDIPPLISLHPDTLKWIPGVANKWAFADDNKTVYFKLNPKARWSDGKPLTADDYVFTLKIMRSKDIVAPWYNDFYTNTIASVKKYDNYTISVSTVNKLDRYNLLIIVSITPTPKHFYENPKKDKNKDGIADDFVKRYNFAKVPTIGPYIIDKIKKGKNITFKHLKDWWGYSNPYYKNIYNINKISINVIRDNDIALKHFAKGDLDYIRLTYPSLWHDKSNFKGFKDGYIYKFWGYNYSPVGASGLWLNTAKKLLKNKKVREGIMYATDYDGLIAKILRGDYSRVPNAMGTGHGDYDMISPKVPNFDPKKAIKLFKEAGFDKIGADGIRVNDKGERLSVAISYGYSIHTPRITYLKEQAKKTGLEYRVNLVDGSSFFKSLLEKKHEAAFLDMTTNIIPSYWEYFHSDNANKKQTNNFTNYSSPELDDLIMAYKSEFNVDKKIHFSREIQKMIQDAYVIVPGYMLQYNRFAAWRWLKMPKNPMKKTGDGITYYRLLSTLWIDKDIKRETKKAMKSGKTFDKEIIKDFRYKK